ncbi:MAG: 50S ribosomal protein L23 [Deltaproteobacteria bacterium]|nr:50S ribosomal protein L23 [Deltaproteobacteria bacterium]
MAEIHDIILRPLVTERSANAEAQQNTYVFEVGESANKLEIKNAVEQFFAVKVEDVRTVRVRGKFKRFGRHYGKRSNWKKAYVKLASGHSINLFEA